MNIYTQDLVCISDAEGNISNFNLAFGGALTTATANIFDFLDVDDKIKVEGALKTDAPSYSVFIVNLQTRIGIIRSSVSITRKKDDDSFCFIFRDSVLEKQEAALDGLTKLPTRDYLNLVLKKAIGRAERNSSYAFTVLFLDLDGFKEVNDTAGHLIGDKLLGIVAIKLVRAVRPVDTVIRYGGDEFIVILDGVKEIEGITNAVSRIEQDISNITSVDGYPIKIGVSVGISPYESGATIERLIEVADKSMYKVKRERGNIR
jgi:diguanylate cyclase (GGDEF)-like protein